jgi:anti-anti-sigma factor
VLEDGGHPNIAVTHDPHGVAFVHLTGEHDQYSASQIGSTLADELAAGRSVIVDLGGASFLDSTSAGALLVAHERAAKADLRLVVLLAADAGWPVHRLFETARLGTILTVVTDHDAALAAVQQATA